MRGIAILMGVLLLLLASGSAHALAQSPPSGLDDTLAEIVTKAYAAANLGRGWSTAYGLPQSQFSVDENDSLDKSAEFGEVGLYILGMQTLSNPLIAELEIDPALEAKISAVAASTQAWVWVPGGTPYGVAHDQRMPHNGIANVMSHVQGVGGASNTCADVSVGFNTWGVPKDTVNKQAYSQLTSLAGAGHIFLAASYVTPSKKNEYLGLSKSIADNLLTFIVTPEEEEFGIHPSELEDTHGNSIPIGMMPYEFTIKNDSPDTLACQDGGTVKVHENRKTHMAQTALFLVQLSNEVGDAKYARAAELITNGIMEMQECDGSYQDYTRWEGPGTIPNRCTPSDGSEAYDAYPGNVVTSSTRGFLIDTSMILYLVAKADPEVYKANEHYRTAVEYLLTLEEEDQGSGKAYNGDPIRYASYSIDVELRPYAQIMLSNVLLRASCNETDSAMEERLQTMAYALINKAAVNIPSELDAKIGNAIAPDVGNNVLAASAAADSWKIITKGCQECTDEDDDGFIDGVCAQDTVKYDCNDSDATIYPGATEVCDNVDNDCDGNVDDGFDDDNDGVSICAIPVDCNDGSNEVYPGASEAIDEVDNDCDGKIDNTGIEVTIQDDLNRGISNVEVIFIDYGNACANSFATLVSSIPQIKAQCTTAGSCVTDSNGTCLAAFKKDGKYQGLADIPGDGQASNPVDFEVGKKYTIVFASDTNAIIGEGQPDGDGPVNPFTSNPLVLVVLVLILGGVGVYFFIKSGKFKLPIRGTSPAKGDSTGLGGDKTRPLTKPVVKATPKEGVKFKMPRMSIPALKLPTISAKKIASKIVESKPIGGEADHAILRPGGFSKKNATGGRFNPGKPRKIWKDE